jgi:transposase, IS5 family
MPKRKSGGSRQKDLIPLSMRPAITIGANHRLAILADEIDWTDFLMFVELIRLSKVKNAAGRPAHLRALVGALLLRAVRKPTYRETEDLIRYYAPARYLCGLTETDWSPDHNTICDFEKLLGEDGVKQINEYAVKWAVAEKLADPSVVVGDMTAQEAAIPYPNEMGHMAAFMATVSAASKRAGKTLKAFAAGAAEHFEAAKKVVREYRLFAKTKEARLKVMAKMMTVVGATQKKLGSAIQSAAAASSRITKYGKVAQDKVRRIHETMQKLLPQIAYWHRTGKVAAKKIISVHIPELYSIVRGKIAKEVEFGLAWGITRLRGGFLLAKVAMRRNDLHDSRFAVEAVDDCKALFGRAPRAYAYDRAGWSVENVRELKKKGVKEVGLAPLGSAKWAVSDAVREELVKERALVEAGIGTVKTSRYGFNKPAARSINKMGVCGQRALLGFNLGKLVRGLAERRNIAVVW